jgi:hypothetical protein
MSSIDWKEYVIEVIKNFRKRYEDLADVEVKKIVKEKFYENTLLEPCQVEVLASSGEVDCFVAHDRNVDDMEITIREVPVDTRYTESEFLKKYSYVFLGDGSLFGILPNRWVVFHTKNEFHPLEGRPKPSSVIDLLLGWLLEKANEKVKSERVTSLEKSASGLEASISKLPESEARSRLDKQAKEIGKALEDIKRVDKELLDVRKIMGASKEYQDWRVLVSDVDRLKGEHLPKGEFEKEIDRLDERIDALNSRIDDLREVRFARARTILEIALGVMTITSTIIAALLAAHIV